MFPGIWEAVAVLASGVVLAHQGGWDEALMVVTPIALFAGLLWVATRRAAPPAEDARPSGALGPADHHGDR